MVQRFVLRCVVVTALVGGAGLWMSGEAQAPRKPQIVFVSGWPNQEISVVDADGGNLRNLTNSPDSDQFPSASPDGSKIAFTSSHWSMDIFVMDADGRNPILLTSDPGEEWRPVWSPDGKKILYGAPGQPDACIFPRDIYVMDADGQNQRRLTDEMEIREITWSSANAPSLRAVSPFGKQSTTWGWLKQVGK